MSWVVVIYRASVSAGAVLDGWLRYDDLWVSDGVVIAQPAGVIRRGRAAQPAQAPPHLRQQLPAGRHSVPLVLGQGQLERVLEDPGSVLAERPKRICALAEVKSSYPWCSLSSCIHSFFLPEKAGLVGQ